MSTIVEEPEEAAGETIPAAGSREIGSLELTIGGSWLNRIGVGLVVIGIAFALGYTLTHLGPAGKAMLATAAALAMLAGGIWLERHPSYRSYARGLIAGGWAALYATAYAVHELEATRIIEDARIGFLLLMLVGIGMIGHSLRYRNEGLTSLAYGLAYAAIVLHSISGYTLAAGALLGLGTVIHLLRRQWYGMAFGGIAATYGSLFLWYQRQQPMTSETLHLGLAALAIDWLVFLAADISPDPTDDSRKIRARAVSLLNALAAAWLAYMAWAGVTPTTAWQPLLLLGFAYVATSGVLRRTGRYTSHQIHSLAAALFVGIATGKALELTLASWVWLAEAQAVILLGVWLKDRFHRLLGCALFVVPLMAIFIEQFPARLQQPDGVFDLNRLLLTAAACVAFYLTFALMKPFHSTDQIGQMEANIRRGFSYAAFGLVLVATWIHLPQVYVAPANALLMLLLFEISSAFRMTDLRIQCHLSAACAVLAAVTFTASSHMQILGMQARVPSLIIVALALYTVYARLAVQRTWVLEQDDAASPAVSSAGFLLVLLALWFQLPHHFVAPASAVLMLILFEISRAFGMKELRIQSYLAAAWATISVLAFSAPSHEEIAGMAARIPVLILVALSFFVLFARLTGRRERLFPQEELLRPYFPWAGATLAALAVWLEARPVVVGPAWMLMALIMAEAGIGFKERHLRQPGYALLIASHVSLAVSNLTAPDIVSGFSIRAATMIPAIAATYYLWWRLRALPGHPAGDAAREPIGDRYDERFGRLLAYIAAVMVGLFSRFEFGLDGASLRWSIAMFVLFVVGYALGDADFRLQAYGLGAAVSLRAIGFDFVHAGPVMGVSGPLAVALVGVFAYILAGLVISARIATGPRADRRTLGLESRLQVHGRDMMWLLSVALAAVYLYRTQAGFILIVLWAIEGLLATVCGFASRSQALRFAGLGLLALALVMTLVRALTTFDTIGRIVSFIVLGVVLLLVSLRYTHYRQRARNTP
ncbi:MAG TPA: DUF2339 domain-containing protein [Patescibacteria group bacterium]|nr:DUF2339 domain-containing protein [Patescibacteria group bacterium]